MNGFNNVPGKPKTIFLDVKPTVDQQRRYSSALNTNRKSVVLYGADGVLNSAANRQYATVWNCNS